MGNNLVTLDQISDYFREPDQELVDFINRFEDTDLIIKCLNNHEFSFGLSTREIGEAQNRTYFQALIDGVQASLPVFESRKAKEEHDEFEVHMRILEPYRKQFMEGKISYQQYTEQVDKLLEQRTDDYAIDQPTHRELEEVSRKLFKAYQVGYRALIKVQTKRGEDFYTEKISQLKEVVVQKNFRSLHELFIREINIFTRDLPLGDLSPVAYSFFYLLFSEFMEPYGIKDSTSGGIYHVSTRLGDIIQSFPEIRQDFAVAIEVFHTLLMIEIERRLSTHMFDQIRELIEDFLIRFRYIYDQLFAGDLKSVKVGQLVDIWEEFVEDHSLSFDIPVPLKRDEAIDTFRELGGKLTYFINQRCLYLSKADPSDLLPAMIDERTLNMHLSRFETEELIIGQGDIKRMDHMYLAKINAESIVIRQQVTMLHLSDVNTTLLDIREGGLDLLEFSWTNRPIRVWGHVKRLVVREQALKQVDLTDIDFDELTVIAEHTIRLKCLEPISDRLTHLKLITDFADHIDLSNLVKLKDLIIQQRTEREYEVIEITTPSQLETVMCSSLITRELKINGDSKILLSNCIIDQQLPADFWFQEPYHNFTLQQFTWQVVHEEDAMYNKSAGNQIKDLLR